MTSPVVPRTFRRSARVRAAAAALAGLALAGCATVPYTGRRQLSMMSGQQEQALGEQLYLSMKQETRISGDPAAQGMVQEVGRRIAAVADQPGWNWEFTLFDEDEVNAWALPGGKVGIYSGILPVARDEDGLAAIIGHEVAHAIAHHASERASQQQLAGLLGAGVGIAAGSMMSPGAAQAASQLFGLGTQVGVLLPFSREQESEADEIGLILMAKAGYDPRAAVGLWERMGAIERREGAPVEFLSTHPGYQTRIARIQAAMPRALAYYQGDGGAPRPLPAVASRSGSDRARPSGGGARNAPGGSTGGGAAPPRDPRAAPTDDTALRDGVRVIDALARNNGRAVASSVATEFRLQPSQVVALSREARLSPGEGALVLAVAADSGRRVGDVLRAARGTDSWEDVAGTLGASPDACADSLARIVARLR